MFGNPTPKVKRWCREDVKLLSTTQMRSYTGEADIEAMMNLQNACEAVDQFGYWATVESIQRGLEFPSFNKQRDLRLWEDHQGNLIAMARLNVDTAEEGIDGYLGFQVHPTVRGKDLEHQIIAWGIQRLGEVARERGRDLKLRSGARDHQEDRITLLQGHGFVADRYFFTMKRSLQQPIPDLKLPQGFTVRTVQPEADAERWVEMFNQTFIDHCNHHELTLEQFNHSIKHPDYRPELDLIAIAPDGTFAGFCECDINLNNNKRNGRHEGWIAMLGTRRGFRKQGLGRAMLLTGLRCLKAEGMEIAKLGVDSQNPSGALGLYESVGFEKMHSNISFVKDISFTV